MLPRLAGLPLLPVGAGEEGKAPVDPSTGRGLASWQHAAWTPEQIAATDPAVVTAVGCRFGPDAGGLLCIDVDGASALEHLLAAGCDPDDAGWRINRSTASDRMKLVFRVPPDQWPQDGSRRAGKVKFTTGQGEQLELFWSTGQAVVAGLHRPSGAFLEWHGGPEAITDLPPPWLALWEELAPQPAAAAPAPGPITPRDGAIPLENLLPKELEQLALNGAPEGSRNDAMFRLAASAVAIHPAAIAAGLSVDGTPELVVLNAAARCSPPLPETEALTCLRSAESQQRQPDPGWRERLRYQLNRRASAQPPAAANAHLPRPADSQAGGVDAAPGRGNGAQAQQQPDHLSRVAHELDSLLGPYEEGKLRRPRADKLTQALGLILRLRYNLLTGRIEHNGQAIHGDFLGGLYLQLAEEYQLDVNKDRAIDAAIRLARNNAYHPVRDYLNSITTTLSPEDWAAIDVRCFGREEHTGIAGLHLQRQLIGLVARVMQPGCELQTALVIHSDRQGVGKSSLWRILGGEWFSDSLGDLRNLKDDLLQLHSAWIHEWGEIDMVMGKQESEMLKRFLSASRDNVRKPYGRGVETLERSCGIVGTTNRRDFIKDPTGNRRYPIISIDGVDLGWVAANRDAIWGSAVAAYRNGTRWQYDGNENSLVSANALAFAPEDPLRERIETWVEEHPRVAEAPLVQILKGLGLATDDQSIRCKAGNALTSLGWTRTEKKARYDLPWGERTNTTYGWRRPA